MSGAPGLAFSFLPRGAAKLREGEPPLPDLKPLGRTGLRRFGGVLYEEFLQSLSGTLATRVYREMSENDAVVGSILFAIEMLIRKADWRIEADGEKNRADEEAAEFVETCREDMSNSWENLVAEILSFLPYGWSYFETIYKRRDGDVRDPTRRSKYDDGRIGWRKIEIRAQDSLIRWEFDEEDGGLVAMVQQPPPDYKERTIPIDKSLLFRTSSYKGSPEGRSVLRTAYRSWYLKKRLEEIEGIGIERDLAGLPKARVPAPWLADDAPAEDRKALEATRKLVRDIRQDSQSAIIVPAIYDKDGNLLFDIELMASPGSRQFDTTKVIERWDRRVAMTVLADFILLGHEKVGSFALSSSKTALFATAIGAWLDEIAGVFNRHAIPRLLSLNSFPGLSATPKLVPGDVETVDLKEIGDYITALAGAGMPLFPDEELENYLREQGGMPPPEPGGGRIEPEEDGSEDFDVGSDEEEPSANGRGENRLATMA